MRIGRTGYSDAAAGDASNTKALKLSAERGAGHCMDITSSTVDSKGPFNRSSACANHDVHARAHSRSKNFLRSELRRRPVQSLRENGEAARGHAGKEMVL